MPAEAHTQVPANPKTGPLLERLIRERRPTLERIAARTVRPDQVEDAIQSACLGFLRAFDPDASSGGTEGAFRYLKTAVDNSAAKIVRGEMRRKRGLPPAAHFADAPDPVDRAVASSGDPVEISESRSEAIERLMKLGELPAEQRQAMVLRAAGFLPAEIEAELDLSPRQYRKRIEKARQRLQALPEE